MSIGEPITDKVHRQAIARGLGAVVMPDAYVSAMGALFRISVAGLEAPDPFDPTGRSGLNQTVKRAMREYLDALHTDPEATDG
jgi:hypothetical protein